MTASGTTTNAATELGARPSLLRRFGALMVDWAMCVLAARALTGPIRQGWPPVLMLIIEYAFFIGLFAQTPGMWVARIRCVPVSGRSAIGIPRAAMRGVLLCLVVPALIMDAEQRGLHDRLAGTRMVSGRRATD